MDFFLSSHTIPTFSNFNKQLFFYNLRIHITIFGGISTISAPFLSKCRDFRIVKLCNKPFGTIIEWKKLSTFNKFTRNCNFNIFISSITSSFIRIDLCSYFAYFLLLHLLAVIFRLCNFPFSNDRVGAMRGKSLA